MPVSVGIMLRSRETAMTGLHDARGLIAFARAAEDAGFDSVWVGASLVARTRAEPLSVLAAVAAVTTRVALGTAALIAPLRHPLLVAAQAATVDQLSAGRLILGLRSVLRRRRAAANSTRSECRSRVAARGSTRRSRCGARHGTGKANSPMHCRRRGRAVRRSGSLVATRRKSSNAARPPMTVGCRICRT